MSNIILATKIHSKLLSFSNTVSGEQACKLLRRAEEEFAPLASLPEVLKGHEDAGPLWALPDGSQLVLVTSKVLDGYEEPDSNRREIQQESLGRNHLYLTQEEIAALSADSNDRSVCLNGRGSRERVKREVKRDTQT